jgi:hypothetical protein
VKKARSGTILGNVDGAVKLMNWDNSGVLAGSPVVWVAMGTKRFVGEWQTYGLQSYSLEDGTQYRFVEILKPTPSGLGVWNISSAGDYFLYNLFDHNQFSFPLTMISDGGSPGIQYTTPPPGASDGNIKFADSHVAWLRGFNQKGTNKFEKVELWASEFSPDPSKLKPYKVADVTGGQNTTSNWALHGGWGRLAYQEYDLGKNGNVENIRVRIFDLKSLQKRDIPLPVGERGRYIRGLTRTHAWFMTDEYNNAPRQLYRWKIDSIPIVP